MCQKCFNKFLNGGILKSKSARLGLVLSGDADNVKSRTRESVLDVVSLRFTWDSLEEMFG